MNKQTLYDTAEALYSDSLLTLPASDPRVVAFVAAASAWAHSIMSEAEYQESLRAEKKYARPDYNFDVEAHAVMMFG